MVESTGLNWETFKSDIAGIESKKVEITAAVKLVNGTDKSIDLIELLSGKAEIPLTIRTQSENNASQEDQTSPQTIQVTAEVINASDIASEIADTLILPLSINTETAVTAINDLSVLIAETRIMPIDADINEALHKSDELHNTASQSSTMAIYADDRYA
jgi:hypothetical protein